MAIANQIGGVNSLSSGAVFSDNILTLLGLKGWTLKNGKFNGCTFLAFSQIPGFGNIPGTGLYESASSLYASINAVTGQSGIGGDPNGSFGSLIDTLLGIVQFDDELKPQVAVKELPYANRCNTENTGYGGWVFPMSLLFIGTDYQKALASFENAIANPPINNYLVLEHPTRGKIPGITRVIKYKVITSLAHWNGAMVNLTFRSEQSLIQQSPTGISAKDIANALSAALAAALALQNAISSALAFLGLSGNVPPSPANQTKVNTIQKSNVALSQTLTNNLNYIYQNSNTGVVNSTLATLPIDYTYVPKILTQSNNYNASQANYLIDYYQQQAANSISVINAQNIGGASNIMINTINQSVAAFYRATVLLAPTQTNNSYVTPYDMSIREVLARNGLAMTQATNILTINPTIPSANYIPKGFIVNLS